MVKKFSNFFKVRSVEQEIRYSRFLEQLYGIKPPIIPKFIILFFLSLFASLFTVFIFKDSNIPREALFMGGIFVFAAFLWVTEALPLFATSLVVVALEIILLANPGSWSGLGFQNGSSPGYTEFLSPMADPIIILFFGGLLLANATVKEGIDKVLAGFVLKFFGSKPAMVMLGLMTITAVFSMWISNTATAAMMIALTVPIIRKIPVDDPFRKGIVLCIPFAANIGGLGTPIASPPNAVAIGYLRKSGFDITFFEWTAIALPLMAFMLIFCWAVLYYLFKPLHKSLQLNFETVPIDRRGWFVVIIFCITVSLWLTETWHGLPTAVVAILPAIAFTTTGLITREDVDSLEWHILILIIGGIALGFGMQSTGLDKILVNAIPLTPQSFIIVVIIATILLSTFMSNTAASNLLIPIGVSFALSQLPGDPVSAMQIGISIALAASLAMALPISTPPNTIAYARGELESRDFMVPGIIVGLLGFVLITVLGKMVISFWL